MATVSMSLPLTSATQLKGFNNNQPKGLAIIKSFPSAFSTTTTTKNPSSRRSFRVDASSLKERAVAGATAAALAASMAMPEVASAAADSSLTPSLENFLLSIAAGGFVLAAIGGAIVGVSNFDPVKRA
ncbi:unnamed protein product [Linum trigynum]|uniref:Uncharacterized protein n=1 Tax=Linum trigynum TaxID=586398 RepID=A0AAV2EWP9_9ROSI